MFFPKGAPLFGSDGVRMTRLEERKEREEEKERNIGGNGLWPAFSGTDHSRTVALLAHRVRVWRCVASVLIES